MTTEQAYFLTVALINLVFAFSGTRIQDPANKPKSIHFFIIAFSANFLSWFLYVFDINTALKIVSAVFASIFIWGMVVFSYRRCEYPLPWRLISSLFLLNCLALGYFTYLNEFYATLHVSGLFVPLAYGIMSYLFLNLKQQRSPSDIILAYAFACMALIVFARSLILDFSTDFFSATVISSQIIWPAFSVISGVFALLSFTEEAQLKLKQESNTDQLTGLSNRRCMNTTLNNEWARAIRYQRPLALIMLDVDFFKSYNDYYGHQAGDDCLKDIAQALRQTAQRAGDMTVRYGGEEFLLILPDTDNLSAKHLAEHICSSIAQLNIPHQHSPLKFITISAGIAVLNKQNYNSITELLKAADTALYAAKQNGRNQVRLTQH
ncbi:diguanylate cyclase [Amphritea sp. 1_MG-2023]|uniref:GGDEF domain-containing protein n=1 Tax=Amphritea sp. 1_MG-2023 TaxID=3062670 RepID=UPI0026E2A654|nr:diguanylate cyclase [Amphritea sp. 1_MG-2023]MDO6562010.1 diguanylate cyclase [Amphritea sp. 1_MG-2023]